MSLISKQEAVDEIRAFQSQITCSSSEDWLNGMNEGFDHAVAVIELMETVDAVPIVRCEECKWCLPTNMRSALWCKEHETITFKRSYCSWGKKNETD